MKRASIGLAVLLSVACSKADKSSEVRTTGAQPTNAVAAGGALQPEAGASSPGGSANPAPPDRVPNHPAKPIVTFKAVGLVSPESVLYDDRTDEYIVSNTNGDPFAADDNGFISRLRPDGSVVDVKWIASKKNGVKLNAPRGLAVSGDKLYVTDMDRVRIFDRKTGAPDGEVVLPGATFANDLATMPDGRIVASDSGLRHGKESFEPTHTDAVYVIDKDEKPTTLAKSPELGRPNGLLATANDKVWVVGFGSGELYWLDPRGKKNDVQKLPKGAIDGIVALANGDLLISSWDASSVFRGKPGGHFEIVVDEVKCPADIGYDTKRGRVLIPLFQDNEVRAYEVK